MIKEYTQGDLKWVDLLSPTSEEVRTLVDKYGIHPIAAEGLILATQKPKIENYGDMIYLVLHFPAWKHSHTEVMQEVDCLVGKNLLITARYEHIDALERFIKIFETNLTLNKKQPEDYHAGFLFCSLMKSLYNALSNELDFVSDLLSSIEKNIFEGKEREMVFELSNLSRELLSFKHATAIHKDILESFEVFALPIFGENFSASLKAVNTEYAKIEKTVNGHTESLSELRETNNSMLETKQNIIIQKLTIITFITSIVAIFGTLLQIDTKSRPLVGMDNDFWIIVGLVLISASVMLAVFKWKKWF